MSEKTKKATDLFGGGNNCAQAVLGAFAQDYGLGGETAHMLAAGLGSGVRSAEVCGAVLGAVLVIGLKHGADRDVCNQKTEAFMARFKAENGSVLCRGLLGCDVTTPAGRQKAVAENLFTTTCVGLVVGAVALLEEMGY